MYPQQCSTTKKPVYKRRDGNRPWYSYSGWTGHFDTAVKQRKLLYNNDFYASRDFLKKKLRTLRRREKGMFRIASIRILAWGGDGAAWQKKLDRQGRNIDNELSLVSFLKDQYSGAQDSREAPAL
jgi:endo-1,4-beta-D-glucanase Y